MADQRSSRRSTVPCPVCGHKTITYTEVRKYSSGGEQVAALPTTPFQCANGCSLVGHNVAEFV